MSGWGLLVLVLGAIAAVMWIAIDFGRDALLFLSPEQTAKRRLHQQHGDGEAYDRAITRLNERKPASIIGLRVTALIGMLGTLWLIFG